ncbi:glycosyltransferase [Sphingomonas mucosissima]|uniref:glycosyltransferase n=1 Tax=Sphingomonas mucosissima TaxID=370959 RepID=UPI00146BD529|nr:glycosyltransferase [Sphingomonas mucosissima]
MADPAFRLLRADPVLFGAFDEALIMGGVAPAVLALSRPPSSSARDCLGDREEALMKAGRDGRVAHIPRVIATQLSLPLIARSGRAEQSASRASECSMEVPLAPAPLAAAPRDDWIAVVIPTRDRGGLLARAIDTLRSKARRPERLDIVVVDNRSTSAEAAALFDRLNVERTARVVPFDSPFNWSLASNLGAGASDAPLIAFVNNDVEMLSAGWDDAVADALSHPHVGAVGARLLYPDQTVQHAGIAFGFGPGGTEHEGRGVPAADPGPGNRYVLTHAVSAVTGAFLAVRRADFDQLKGFDAARLMIAHSDVDLCLRLRELGKVILYCPAIEAIHHEGATRGLNETQAAIAWDEGERLDLLDRWGEALANDPGISPYWQRNDRPLALLREPTIREILAHVDQSASSHPWQPVRSG